MRSRRSRLERGCRIAAFALLGWLIGTSLFPSPPIRLETAHGANVAARLDGWTRMPPSTELHVDLSTVPDSWIVDWLAALRHSGHVVRWSGSPPAALMVAEPVVDPERRVHAGIAAPSGATVVLADAASPIDTLRVHALGATATLPLVVGPLHATVGAQMLAVSAPSHVAPRAAYVIGRAGWEGKYLVTALEERGWPVVARFAVAPGVNVTQGDQMLDTSRVSVVIALDTTIDRLGDAVARYVRTGGGLVLAGTAAAAPNVRAIAPGVPGSRLVRTVPVTSAIGLGTTGFYPLAAMAHDAVALERRDSAVTIAVRRVASGRVMQVGYDDTWRWRMAGGEGSVAAQRAWWSRVVEAVAYVPGGRIAASPGSAAAAPLASLVDRLGPAVAGAAARERFALDRILTLMLIMMCLCTEWLSRRLRGAR